MTSAAASRCKVSEHTITSAEHPNFATVFNTFSVSIALLHQSPHPLSCSGHTYPLPLYRLAALLPCRIDRLTVRRLGEASHAARQPVRPPLGRRSLPSDDVGDVEVQPLTERTGGAFEGLGEVGHRWIGVAQIERAGGATGTGAR